MPSPIISIAFFREKTRCIKKDTSLLPEAACEEFCELWEMKIPKKARRRKILIFVTLGDEETYKIAGRCPADLGGADQGAW